MRFVVSLERAWDAARFRRSEERPPSDFRIEAYLGHAGPDQVVVRGRVLDDPPPTEAVEGEGVRAAVRRTLSGFVTDELPGVPLRIRVGGATDRTPARSGCSPRRLTYRVEGSDVPACW